GRLQKLNPRRVPVGSRDLEAFPGENDALAPGGRAKIERRQALRAQGFPHPLRDLAHELLARDVLDDELALAEPRQVVHAPAGFGAQGPGNRPVSGLLRAEPERGALEACPREVTRELLAMIRDERIPKPVRQAGPGRGLGARL